MVMFTPFSRRERQSESAAGPRQRLRSLTRQARAAERPEQQRAPDEPSPQEEPARAGPGKALSWVSRLLPESWQQSRVDPGRRGRIGMVAAAVGITVLIAAVTWWNRPVAEPAPVLPPPIPPPPAPTTTVDKIVVSVVGEVAEPGLVTLHDGDRVADALRASGGATPGTDITALNLARKVSDGEQLHVGIPVPAGMDSGAADPDSSGTDDKLDLNTATAEQLGELPGVGPSTARKILTWREDNGGFDAVEQLDEVGGIGPKRLAELEDLVRT